MFYRRWMCRCARRLPPMDIRTVNSKNQPTYHSVLRDLLARNPGASLQQIRHSHPAFQTMSMDHLGLKVSQALHALRGGWLK